MQAGLDLAKRLPLDQLSADEVAREAGVSKALVFHHFESTRDLQLAILEAASLELYELLQRGTDLTPAARLRSNIRTFVEYVRLQPDTARSLFQLAGSDPHFLAVFDQIRDGVVSLIAEAVGITTVAPPLHLALRGWVATAEHTMLLWLVDQPVPEDELVDFLARALVAMLRDAADLGWSPEVGPPRADPRR